MEGRIIEIRPGHRKIVDSNNEWYSFKPSDILKGEAITMDTEVTFDPGPAIITKKNLKTIKTAINVRCSKQHTVNLLREMLADPTVVGNERYMYERFLQARTQ